MRHRLPDRFRARPVTDLLVRYCLMAMLFACSATAAHASWLDGVRSMITGPNSAVRSNQLTVAAGMIAGLKVKPPGLVLAATVTPEGHWTFVNQSGQRYTTTSEQELARVYTNLASGIKVRPAPVVIYLTASSVFDNREHLAALPTDARLRLVAGKKSYPLRGFGRDDKRMWFAEVRTNLFVRTVDAAVFSETVWQLARPLSARVMRVLALQPGAPDTFRPYAKSSRDGAQQIDAINPLKLLAALPTLRRQTAVITGRLEDRDRLIYRTPSSGERELRLAPLRTVAAGLDTNLLFVNASAPRQPGQRNWLWLRVEVDGLVEALQRKTLGDFLNALAGSTNQLFAEAKSGAGPRSTDRVRLSVIPMRAGVMEQEPGTISSLLAELVSEVAGSVLPHAVDADLVSMTRQQELDRRLVPGVASVLQYAFGVIFLVSMLGLPVALQWWRRIWRPEARSEYANRTGFEAARGMRWLVFLLLFLPIVGMPAILWGILRWFSWLLRGGWRHDKADAGAVSG
ncbi:MAG: hypothetical protein ACI9XZ_002054 [Alphaproteobacteria bacterium]|jgi:hypothetical protein